MLTVENATLHYGAAQALRGVSLKAERQDHLRARPQRRRQDQLMRADRRHQPLTTGA